MHQGQQSAIQNHNSPIRLINGVYKDSQNKIIDQDTLYEKLNLILQTLYHEKDEFEERVNEEKRVYQERISKQSQIITELQSKVQQLQQQTRQLRFNYHQRGAVVEYLKKKVITIENKLDSEKQEMVSVVKYLQSRNSQLNEIIYQLKNKQAQLNTNIVQLQEKLLNLTNEYCSKAMTSRPPLASKLNTRRTSISNKYEHCDAYFPLSIQKKTKNDNNQSYSRENLQNLFLEELNNNDSFVQSTVREKTIKYENSMNRVRSEDQIDFAQLNHIISLGGANSKTKNTEIQQIPAGKSILINNYGHLNLGNYQQRPTSIIHQKKHYLSKPKLSLPNHGRYTQLSTRRTNKEPVTSRQF